MSLRQRKEIQAVLRTLRRDNRWPAGRDFIFQLTASLKSGSRRESAAFFLSAFAGNWRGHTSATEARLLPAVAERRNEGRFIPRTNRIMNSPRGATLENHLKRKGALLFPQIFSGYSGYSAVRNPFENFPADRDSSASVHRNPRGFSAIPQPDQRSRFSVYARRRWKWFVAISPCERCL